MQDLFRLDGKTIVVTGGTGILGASFVRAIAQSGARVAILGRNLPEATSRAEAICAAGGQAIPVQADVLVESSLQAAAELIMEKWGSVDGLVNAAGGNLPGAVVDPAADLFSLNMEALKSVYELNLMGTILPTQVFGRQMATQKRGSIVNISSVSASRALTRVLGYSLAKSGIEAYTRWMAVELANRYGDSIRMNALVPGFFLTEQNKNLLTTPTGEYTDRAQAIVNHTPFNRLGNPQELEGGLIWLLSDAARFVTGTTITIDGGFSAFSGV